MLRDYCSDALGPVFGSDRKGEDSGEQTLSEEIIDVVYAYLGVRDVRWGVASELITGESESVRYAQRKYYKAYTVVDY